MGGWSLIVVYQDTGLTGKTLVLYDGFDLERNGAVSYLLTGIYSADPPEAKTTFLVWEGDDDLGGSSETLEFNGAAQSDGLNPVNNVYNSTINSLGVTDSYGLDLDTFDVSGEVSAGDTLATTRVSVGPDLVVLNAVVLQDKSNIIVGKVFEDVNYGGGAGRNLPTSATAAPSFTLARPDAVVELYDAGGAFLRTTTTGPTGEYSFTGLVDGDYQVRVVNETVDSSRPGAAGTEWPIQTYRTDASSGTAVAVVDEVGGASPGAQDDGENTAPEVNLSTLTAQSVAPVTITTGIAVSSVDFGYNFDTIVNTNDTGQGSLDQFVRNANTLGNANLAQDGRPASIENAIFMLADGTARPGLKASYPSQFSGGVATIAPDPTLPTVSDPVVLDATLQPGHVDRPIIELDGTDAGVGVNGIHVSAGSSTVRGFVIHTFNGSGIRLDMAGGNTVAANWLGTDATGAAPAPNNLEGLLIYDVPNNVIGGTDPADRNVMSGNRLRGMLIEGVNATGNRIEGNYVGTDWTGTIAVPNDIGIYLYDAPGNFIGGTAQDAGNLISGNDIYGIYLVRVDTTGNLVQGNTIGLESDGSGPLGNVEAGVEISSAVDNMIGGADPDAANVITGSDVGIGLVAGSGNAIRGNSIYGNASVSIDQDLDGVTPNDGATGAGANNGLDYPIFTSARLSGTTLSVEGHVGTAALKISGPHTIEVFKADDDGNNDGEVVLGDGRSVAHGEGRWYVDSCASAADGTFDCTLTVPGGITLAVGDTITGTATDGSDNTSEMSANAQVYSTLAIVKRAFQSAGTRTIDLGDGNNSNNAQLDLAADRVWAVVFTIRMQ